MKATGGPSRRTVLKTMGATVAGGSVLVGGAAASSGSLQRELAEVRMATARYNDPANAYADGYVVPGPDEDGDGRPDPLRLEDVVDEAHAACGMGFHFVHFGRLGSTEPTGPTVLVYGVDDEDDLVLGAVEWLVPMAGPYESSPPDLFQHDEGAEEWQADSPAPGLWSLHAWVHTFNPSGVFHPTNPREQFHPEGCIGGH